jgi:dTDP-4-amino-4,6-dideoxygalactose transaminase
MIDLFRVYMDPNVLEHLGPVLASGYVGEGLVSQNFEKKIGEFIKNPNVAVVNSGTSAITLALRLAGVGPGTSVVTTPMTCLATNMPILSLGAHPIWADILPDGNINPEDAYRKIRNDTRAILCVDWGGMPCNLASLRVVADYKSIPLIEDACQSLGGTYQGTPIGNHADAVCFSFQAIKYLTTVDGGALVCNWNHGNLKRAKLLRWFGLDRTQSSMLRCGQDPPDWGYKFQTNDVLASIGLANLASLAERLEIVRGNALQYQEAFKDLQCVKTIPEGPDRQSAFWAYTLLVEDVASFVRFLRTKGVVASKIHDRNDTKTIFAASRQEALPGVDYFDRHHVCIPVGWWVGAPERHTIITAVKEWDTCEAGT